LQVYANSIVAIVSGQVANLAVHAFDSKVAPFDVAILCAAAAISTALSLICLSAAAPPPPTSSSSLIGLKTQAQARALSFLHHHKRVTALAQARRRPQAAVATPLLS
jgi:hypothetical protein